MKKIKKKEKHVANNLLAFSPEDCKCYYPCSCTATPTTAFTHTKNQLTTRNYSGSYLNYN